MKLVGVLLISLLLVSGPCRQAGAQTFQAQMTGAVRDSSGASAPNVKLTNMQKILID